MALIRLRLRGVLSFTNHSDCDEGWSTGESVDIADWLDQVLSFIVDDDDMDDYYKQMSELFRSAGEQKGIVICQ
jgi:hypothetical protein